MPRTDWEISYPIGNREQNSLWTHLNSESIAIISVRLSRFPNATKQHMSGNKKPAEEDVSRPAEMLDSLGIEANLRIDGENANEEGGQFPKMTHSSS